MLQTQPRIRYYDNENYMFWVNINPLVFALLPKILADRISTTKHYFCSLLFSFKVTNLRNLCIVKIHANKIIPANCQGYFKIWYLPIRNVILEVAGPSDV